MIEHEQAFDAKDEAAASLEHETARVPRRRVGTGDKAGKGRSRRGVRKDDGKPVTAVKAIRDRLGHSQRGFWPIFGVTQAAGCRYESDSREIPMPVLMLVLGYAEGKISRALLTDLKELVKQSEAEKN